MIFRSKSESLKKNQKRPPGRFFTLLVSVTARLLILIKVAGEITLAFLDTVRENRRQTVLLKNQTSA